MTATAILLIHGWCGHSGFWRHQVNTLEPPGRRVVALDLGGNGEASITAFADRVVAAADAMDEAALILVGHSMGGAVAIEAATRLGVRCRLVLGVDTFTDARFYVRRPPEEIEARLAVFGADFPGAIAAMVRAIVAREAAPSLIQWITAAIAAARPPEALAALRSLLTWDIRMHWAALPCPVETINSGWLDPRCPQVDGLTGLRVHHLEGVGHFPMLEAPARFNAAARAIIDRYQAVLS